jgi:hypothetical protein
MVKKSCKNCVNYSEHKKRIKWKDRVNNILVISGMVFLIFGILLNGLKPLIFPSSSENKTITFNVTGIENSTDANSLIQLHLECIKYCVSYFSEGYDSQYRCYEQCSLLGKEGC